jgi:hypothetical protein
LFGQQRYEQLVGLVTALDERCAALPQVFPKLSYSPVIAALEP